MDKKEKTIYSDIHWGHPYVLKDFNISDIIFNKNTVLLGDNWDLRNVPRKHLFRFMGEREKAIKELKKKGGIYISGNHSLTTFDKNYKKIRDGVLYTHGDIIEYTLKGVRKWGEEKIPGRSPLSWQILKIAKKIYPGGGKTKLAKKYLERASKLAKDNHCHTICMGHFHPKKLIDINYKGIRVIVVPRGMTKIKL